MLFPRVQLLTAISLAILAGYVVGFIEGENYAYAPNVEASPILGTLLIFSLVCVAAWIYLAVEFDWGITKLKIPRTHSNPPEVTAALTELGKTRGADRLAIPPTQQPPPHQTPHRPRRRHHPRRHQRQKAPRSHQTPPTPPRPKRSLRPTPLQPHSPSKGPSSGHHPQQRSVGADSRLVGTVVSAHTSSLSAIMSRVHISISVLRAFGFLGSQLCLVG